MPANPRVDHAWKDKILRRERFADFAYTLARINWDFFTTHTYKNPLPRPVVRGAMVWRWCQDVSKFSGVPYKNLLIALRRERGEIGDRPHEHCLIGGLTSCNMMAVRSQMMRSWKIISGKAVAEFTPRRPQKLQVVEKSFGRRDQRADCSAALHKPRAPHELAFAR
jgi:hypothetical protein